MKVYGTRILGTGSYLPDNICPNSFFPERGPYKAYERISANGEPIWRNGPIDLTEEKIIRQTGILERRVASPDETITDMSEKAVKLALDEAGITPGELKAIICATISHGPFPYPTLTHIFFNIKEFPVHIPGTVPSAASLLQDRLNAKNVSLAFDVLGACSGFSLALNIAEKIVKSGLYPIAVVASEMVARLWEWPDTNCDLGGDGAGALILTASNQKGQGVIASLSKSDAIDGQPFILFRDKHGFARMPGGTTVMKKAITTMAEYSLAVALEAEEVLGPDRNIKLIIPHQANLRIVDGMKEREKFQKRFPCVPVYRTGIQYYGNTSAASVIIGLDEIRKGGDRKLRLKEGDKIIITAYGGGPLLGANYIIL